MPASAMLPIITSMCNLSMSLIVMPHQPNEDFFKHHCQVCFPTCKGVLNIHISLLDTYLYPSRQLHLPGYYYHLHFIPLLIVITLVKSLTPCDPSLACVTVSFQGVGFSTLDEYFSLVPESTYEACIGIRSSHTQDS
jgi:hypothetical protein